MLFATVAVPVPLGQAFTYSVPESLTGAVARGARVLCPFGRRSVLAVVLSVDERRPDLPETSIKPVAAVVDPEPVLSEGLLEFLQELARYYLAPIGEVVRLALPAVERSSVEALKAQGLTEGQRISAVGRLVQTVRLVPSADAEGLTLRGRAPELFEHLRARAPLTLPELEKTFKSARAMVKRLEAAGLVEVSAEQVIKDPFFAQSVARDRPPELNGPQQAAVDRVQGQLNAGRGGAFLLHGVTGSGKTEVYLRAVQHALGLGRTALILVPEIALTPQLVSRFRARLGDAIAVLHSGLSERERYVMWQRIKRAEVKVVVGARSALFAPVEQLGLICVDEEHDASFKQEEGVRYHARDMALLRAHRSGAVCVLGSATPSVTTFALERAHKLVRLELPDRAHLRASLPDVEIVDLRRMGQGPTGDRWITLPLYRALERTLEERQQAILFLNRRGFAPSLVCEGCGQVVECPSCSVALTVHRARRAELNCHFCDYTAVLPERCPSCACPELAEEGTGTERVEVSLARAFPEARIARLDRDVAAGLKSESILAKMRSGEIDVLVGTQMVTKGHDLPEVTLVGVLNADALLAFPDYQAEERTFQLLVQVAGRAGRGEGRGKVVIQTRNPDHPAIRLAMHHDVETFVERELESRQELGYPPFRRLAMVRIDSIDQKLGADWAEQLARQARAVSGRDAEVLGPTPAPLARLRSRFRYRFLVRAPTRAAVRRVLLGVAAARTDRRVRVAIDVDPVNMM